MWLFALINSVTIGVGNSCCYFTVVLAHSPNIDNIHFLNKLTHLKEDFVNRILGLVFLLCFYFLQWFHDTCYWDTGSSLGLWHRLNYFCIIISLYNISHHWAATVVSSRMPGKKPTLIFLVWCCFAIFVFSALIFFFVSFHTTVLSLSLSLGSLSLSLASVSLALDSLSLLFHSLPLPPHFSVSQGSVSGARTNRKAAPVTMVLMSLWSSFLLVLAPETGPINKKNDPVYELAGISLCGSHTVVPTGFISVNKSNL